MRIHKAGLAFAAAALLAVATACGGGGVSSGGSPAPTTLTYWASNQGRSLSDDYRILQPELDKFQQQTGIKVNVEVIPWQSLLNRILSSATSGQGPDVINIGNTWAASLQATGAFLPFDRTALDQIGGQSRFLATSFAATGAAGRQPTSIPLYGLSYGLFYNKKMFADAGITSPPTTWAEFVADGKKLTHGNQWGLVINPGYTENSHFAFILGQQRGNNLFSSSGQPQFSNPKEVAAVKQYIDFMATDKIINPSDASYTNDTAPVDDFAAGKAAMLMSQMNAMATMTQDGMTADQYGVAPIPFPDPTPAGGKRINSHVGGINISVFANSKNTAGALKFVQFMTSTTEQRILNKAFGTLPVVSAAYQDDPFYTSPVVKVFQQVLAETSAPLPEVAAESQFETTVGNAMKAMWADAASGKPITDQYVQAKLAAAEQQVNTGG